MNKIITYLFNKNTWDIFVDICQVLTPIIIAWIGSIYSKKIDKKILEDNRINRIAKMQSILSFEKEVEMFLYNDSWQNYTYQSNYTNVLLNKEDTNTKMFYGMKFIFHFKNLTDIYPKDILVSDISIWDNKDNVKEQFEDKQLYVEFQNIDNRYKPVTLGEQKITYMEAVCCLNETMINKFVNYKKTNTFFNICAKLKIRNICGIINECAISGKFKIKNRIDLSSGNLGGNKVKIELECKEAFLEVLNVFEEDD